MASLMKIKDKTFFKFLKIKSRHNSPTRNSLNKRSREKMAKKWKGKSFWSSGNTPKASGVAILLKENLDITLLKLNSDTEGRILSLEFLYENQHSQIVNIYAPTRLPCRNKCYKNLKNT